MVFAIHASVRTATSIGTYFWIVSKMLIAEIDFSKMINFLFDKQINTHWKPVLSAQIPTIYARFGSHLILIKISYFCTSIVFDVQSPKMNHGCENIDMDHKFWLW